MQAPSQSSTYVWPPQEWAWCQSPLAHVQVYSEIMNKSVVRKGLKCGNTKVGLGSFQADFRRYTHTPPPHGTLPGHK